MLFGMFFDVENPKKVGGLRFADHALRTDSGGTSQQHFGEAGT
jgi:hypothetical protein